MADLRPVLSDCAAGRIRYCRHRLYRAVADSGMGRSQTGAWPRVERCAVRARSGRPFVGAARRRIGSQACARRIGAVVRGRVPRIIVFGKFDATDRASLRHRHRIRRRNAQRRHADERVLPGSAPRNAHQSDVLRLSARRGVRRLPRRVDDSALGLAERARSRWHHAGRARDPDARSAAGIGSLHGREVAAGRAHSRRARPHFAAARDGNRFRHDRNAARCRR